MPHKRAIVWIDHHTAQLHHLDGGDASAKTLKADSHYTRQHGSAVRAEHEFFGQVCDALAGESEILVTAAHKTQADLRHYVDKHRPALAKAIVGWEIVDHPTEGQLLAFARAFFVKYDRMAGNSTPA
jgi:hypothetical protein